MSWPRGRARDGGLDRVPVASGALWLCGKRVVGPDPEAALARAARDGHRADVIVSFNERHELLTEYADYVAWLDANAGDRALWFPIPDLHAPPVEEALEIVEDLAGRLHRDEGLILHCAGGIGRAPTMAICVLIGSGVDRDEAVRIVAAHRPMAGPEVGAQRELVESVWERKKRWSSPQT